ncbi:hypothetical protein ACIQUQ_26060 [Streptomyces sp. NPDC101118]|uniref:hypothetical protein n=1 Tax=Streptomyces sp. NPDC101118 TaxID=3366109 RepID=UPI0038035068
METTAEKRSSTARRVAAGTAAVALTAAAVAVAAAPAMAAPAAPPVAAVPVAAVPSAAPVYDFGDCPAIPAGVDASSWKCEVLTATGALDLGSRRIPELAPMTVTHAEGPMPDGSRGQVWGALRGGPTEVPGGLLDRTGEAGHPLFSLSLQPEYGGRSDFYSVGSSMGLFTLRFRVRSPLLPRDCVIGGGDGPLEIRLQRVGGSRWLSRNPPVIAFEAKDDTFTAPAAEGCGPLGRLVNRRLGLPAATGNSLTFSATYTFKTYDRLPPR